MRASFVELRFQSQWELVSAARELLLRFFELATGDAALAEKAALAAHELMENAVKYSLDDRVLARMEVEAGGTLRITVESRARPQHLPLLLREIEAVANAPDPLAYYREQMEQAARRTDGKSGLGIARIRCEGGMSLSCSVEGDTVRVIAERAIGRSR